MSPEIAGGLYGAITGGILIMLVEFIKWVLKNKALRKALKIGLFFEIDNNRIVELTPEPDATPNFSIAVFYNTFFNENKADIARLFEEELMQKLSHFYLMISVAEAHQRDLLEIQNQINEVSKKLIGPSISNADIILLENLKEKKKNLQETIRVCLAPALNLQEELCTELKKVFKKDPKNLAFIKVPEKFQCWWEKRN